MRLYVQLGKVGDILNLLPLLRLEASRGSRPGLMVAAEFASILDGVSYVEPHIYPGPYHEVGPACELARTITPDWVCTQVNCSTDQVIKYVYEPAKQKTAVTSSFQKESWRVAGKLAEWDSQPQLFFDGRDRGRELRLMKPWLGSKTKKVLLSVGGVTSPFASAGIVRELIRAKFADRKKFSVIDLADLRAERFYDLLGLYDEAYCLIATDSAPLHLARACPGLPVFAFANDKPLLWNGSPWRPNHTFYCRYNDFPQRVSAFMWSLDNINAMGVRSGQTPAIVHVWSEYAGPSRWPEWFEEYSTGAWRMLPIEVGACGRDSANTIGDERRYPYLKDCLRMGLQRALPEDYVCLTRPDTRFVGGLTQELLAHERSFAYRLERKQGREHYAPIGDLFCARREWWKERLPEIPDLILGTDYFWSHVLGALFAEHKAQDITGSVYHMSK
jgi:hypothetical protein